MSRLGSALLAMIAILLSAPGTAEAYIAQFVIGEPIHVGPDETTEDVACLACLIHVEGAVAGSAVALFGEIKNEGVIERDAVVIGGALESTGTVGGNAVVLTGHMGVAGSVGGSAVTILGSVLLEGDAAHVKGDAVTVVGGLSRSGAGSVGGSVEQVGTDRVLQFLMSGFAGVVLLSALGVLVTLMAVNLASYFILGEPRLQAISGAVTQAPAACFLVGLGTCVGLATTGLMLAMLVPASFPLMIAFVIFSVVGYCGLTYGIGRNLFGSLKPFPAALAAAALTIAIQMVPVVGWLAAVAIWNVAIGAAILSGFGSSANWLTTRGSWSLDRHGRTA